jgi:glutamate synthase domain-containing protein 2/glutamate synthase domain-containing protein 1/glutamate synthase domain-containing protein 3
VRHEPGAPQTTTFLIEMLPEARGLYDPRYEHDACGVAFVARLHGPATHEVVERGITAIENLYHRGATGADPHTGDGAGLLIQIPDELYRHQLDAKLPPAGRYGVAMCFLPAHDGRRGELEEMLERTVVEEGQEVIAWRDVPIDRARAGETAMKSAPCIRQLFVGAADSLDQDAFERKLFVIRRVAEHNAPDLLVASMSSRTIVYKGMLTSLQLADFFPDLRNGRCRTRMALAHSRFSTNTFPSWELAHPYRMIAHNGEINTLMGNVNWMRARESQLYSSLFGAEDLEKLLPIVRPGLSDSATFDSVMELLVMGGRSLAHAAMMMIPAAWQNNDELPADLRDFYAYHSCLMEPWDGPAAVCFSDGRTVGATLDRNGLRPGRWILTKSGDVLLASEAGVLPIRERDVEVKGRLQPGKLFVVDLERNRVFANREAERKVAASKPYGTWYRDNLVHISDLPERPPRVPRTEPLRARQLAFGFSQEDLRVILGPMARDAAEPTASMGNDSALAVLSDRQPPLFNYFKQLFAQVTNPPIDPIRESVVMDISTAIGPVHNLFAETPEHAHQLHLGHPFLRNHQLEKVRRVDPDVFLTKTVDITWPVTEGAAGMPGALDRICTEAAKAITEGADILVLSDRNVGTDRAPIPSLLATGAVHHHLVRSGTRLQAGLVVESGEPRDVHHMATLIGYGASAINPYLMFESIDELADDDKLPEGMSIEEAETRVVKGLNKGLMKILSKMGISTINSYCGAQIFEAVGLDRAVVDRYFTGTASRIGGVGLDVLARETLDRHARAYPENKNDMLPVGGVYQWRRGGEFHAWNPDTIALLQHAVRGNGNAAPKYEEFSKLVNEEAVRRSTLRGLMKLKLADEPIPLDEVEPIEEIVKRFSTGGMSLGALSPEAHETLAVAMNRLGGKSNTGEGGEDERRYGDERRSSIKQVASGRFGVTIDYLVNADQIQIKVAQGAKPGEGGQLPGHKVDDYIAKLRHSTPGVGLISPPPHHDIYSIEDLKQLIYDLRCANPDARISVKLVSEVGVGTVAAGVAKANADHVTIAGHDGGTGASPASSIQYAGVPWEIGLAETQQTLLQQDLRSRIIVETDGQMRTGRDVIIAALLGADEYGFSTAPLVATGCIMMRVCHLNTCPVGIASQDPVLRERFTGKPEHVINYLLLVGEEVRGLMAQLGARTLDELIGRADLLETDEAIDHWKAHGVDLSQVLAFPDIPDGDKRHRVQGPDKVLDDALDWELIEEARSAIDGGEPVAIERRVRNVNRTVGGLLSSQIARKHGAAGLPEETIQIAFRGSAGQSFGAWLAPGVSFTLRGDANDYTAKGMSGGVLAVHPPDDHPYAAEDNVIVGNTVLYGATSGRAFFRGLAGERFAVRNSGVSAVVEGVGDHGCEYMTGGRVVVLGPTGRNFAAGMSGGIAYVLDEDGAFPARCNMELVEFDEIDELEAIDLRYLIAEHAQRTGSPVAERVLSSWEAILPKFVKVMPLDYKRALAELGEDALGSAPAPPAPEPARSPERTG